MFLRGSLVVFAFSRIFALLTGHKCGRFTFLLHKTLLKILFCPRVKNKEPFGDFHALVA